MPPPTSTTQRPSHHKTIVSMPLMPPIDTIAPITTIIDTMLPQMTHASRRPMPAAIKGVEPGV